MKVLFICLGNICRSPLAEAIFLHKIKEKGWESRFQADSRGTANYHVGHPPDPRTIKNAAKNGIQINHVAQQVSAVDLRDFDLIISMDESNYSNILRLKNALLYQDKMHLMRDYDPIGKGKDVPDPYYGGEKDFQNVFEILERSMDGLISYL
jgi:protein-tyrosine phosphatase